MSSGSENYGSRTILWCVPRCVSTALMKCLSFIEDIEVWCEHYAYSYAAREEYMRATNGDLPMEYEGNDRGGLPESQGMSGCHVSDKLCA